MEWLGETISRAGSALLFFHSPEGQNEQTFAETVLKPYMVKIGVYMQKSTLIIPYPSPKCPILNRMFCQELNRS